MQFLRSCLLIGIFIVISVVVQAMASHPSPLVEEHMNLNFRPDAREIGRADPNTIHSIAFGILQKNQDRLQQVLHEVSMPGHPNYGKHWTREQIDELTRNQEGHDKVLSVLRSMPEVEIEKESHNGDYIHAKAPIRVWEEFFRTEFVQFHVEHCPEQPVIRCKAIHVPESMYGALAIVLNTTQLPAPPHKGPIRSAPGRHGKTIFKRKLNTDINKVSGAAETEEGDGEEEEQAL